MPYPGSPHAHLLTPDYWGYDIFDTDLFINVPDTPNGMLSTKEYRRAYTQLNHAMGEVAIGNCTEIRYGLGNQFATDLPDGSLVVLDTETLLRTVPNEPGDSNPDFSQVDHAPSIPFTRPYSHYWRDNQASGKRSPRLGAESITFAGSVLYIRHLKWGILATHKGSRVVQPFQFNWPRLVDGRLELPSSPIATPARALPITLGQTTVQQRLQLENIGIDCLNRIKTVDIVYTAAGDRQVAATPTTGLKPRILRLFGAQPA